MNDNVNDEVVEVVAAALTEYLMGSCPADHRIFRDQARHCVEAAYPVIEKQVLAAARKRVEAEKVSYDVAVAMEFEGNPDAKKCLRAYHDGLMDALAAIGNQDTGEGVEPVGNPEQLPDRSGPLPDFIGGDTDIHTCHAACPCQTANRMADAISEYQGASIRSRGSDAEIGLYEALAFHRAVTEGDQ